jgi:succinate dehydrogenase hydrophobic anchor subunit
MQKQNADLEFIQKRKKLIALWPYAAGFLILLLAGLVAFLWMQTPWLINPYAAMVRIQDNSFDYGSLQMMAMIVPILFSALILILLVFTLLMFAVIQREKKYIALIEKGE